MDECNYTCNAVNEFWNDTVSSQCTGPTVKQKADRISYNFVPNNVYTSDKLTSDTCSTVIITIIYTTYVDLALTVITCLMGSGLLVASRKMCG